MARRFKLYHVRLISTFCSILKCRWRETNIKLFTEHDTHEIGRVLCGKLLQDVGTVDLLWQLS